MKNYYFSCALFFSFLTIIYAEESGKAGCLEKEEALTLLKTAEDFLSKANDAYPSCRNESECGGNLPLSYIALSKKLISDVRENFPKGSKVEVYHDKPRDCSEILANGRNESGVYEIWPRETCTTRNHLKVYCDMKTDYGGWTVIQRRGKFPVQQDFFQDWENYKNGFGNITQEFWLGNENIRILCHKGCEIRFDVQAANGTKRFAVYENFNLTRSSYTLYISHHTGDLGDSMQHHNGYSFSTKDKGDTQWITRDQSGWWSGPKYHTNLNGIYQPGGDNPRNIYWYSFQVYKNLAAVEIKVRPK